MAPCMSQSLRNLQLGECGGGGDLDWGKKLLVVRWEVGEALASFRDGGCRPRGKR
jgi:hypothetical protein